MKIFFTFLSFLHTFVLLISLDLVFLNKEDFTSISIGVFILTLANMLLALATNKKIESPSINTYFKTITKILLTTLWITFVLSMLQVDFLRNVVYFIGWFCFGYYILEIWHSNQKTRKH